MKTKYPPIAKISRPRLSGIFPRDRLFRLLDEGQKKPIVWVAAPAGSGKTTLVASHLDSRKLPCLWYQVDEGDSDLATFFYYIGMAAKKAAPRHRKPLPLLTPEYLQGILVFTRRYFEELFRRLKPPFCVVIDNFQDAPLHSGFHEIIAHALDVIPEGVTVIVLSRTDPPAQLSRLGANNKIQYLGWDEIRFTLEESRNLVEMEGRQKPSNEAIEVLHEKTEGWAAGLVLLMARTKTIFDPHALDHLTQDGIFDYFATEIFEKTDRSMQDVLLKTAFLQKITSAAAEKLTGIDSAGQILERLSRDHYFTQKHVETETVYQYHPLFREFLLSRIKKMFPQADISLLQRRAAAIMEESGQIEESAGLFIDAADWSGAARVILNQAHLLIPQGRSKTLEEWLNRLPRKQINSSPWLLYWLGICRMPFDPCESRSLLEQAFTLFKTGRDMTGTFLSWSSIVDTFVYEWGDFSPLDRWILALEGLLSEHPSFPSPEIEARVTAGMLNALTYRQPHRSDLPLWAGRVKQIILKHQSVQLRMMLGNHLIIYYLWIGDFAKAGLVIDALRPVSGLKEDDPLTQQTWYVMEAMYSWFMADGKTCMQAVTKGFKNAEDTGVHLLDLYLLGQGVYSGLSLGDPLAATSCLEKMSGINSPRLMDKAFYLYQASSVAWYQGDFKKAIEHGKLAVKLTGDVGCPFAQALCLAELAVTLFDDGQYEEADYQLSAGRDVGRGMNHIAYLCFLHGARFAFVQGKEKHGLALLKQGLALGAQQDYVNMPRWNDRNMSRLCAKALEAGIETEYVHKLIKIHNLIPDGSTTGMESWPWPFKVYTLGSFQLVRDGEPVRFSGKVQQKPLALLKALIALGSREVAEERISDILWPDADGDLAHKSFVMTVHRLRKLIGHDKVIQLQERRLTLDVSLCWVDVWALEDLLGKADTAWKSKNESRMDAAKAVRLSEKAVGIYRGHFLPGDSAHACVLSSRERLRSKFLRLIVKLGTHHEQAKQWESAAEVFQKGLELDGLAEEFYQHLMVCYQQLGRRSEAIAVYNRCRSLLSSTLGIVPSTETENLYQSLKNGR